MRKEKYREVGLPDEWSEGLEEGMERGHLKADMDMCAAVGRSYRLERENGQNVWNIQTALIEMVIPTHSEEKDTRMLPKSTH